MSNLVTVPKNGNTIKKNFNYPTRSSWFDDFLLGELPTVFSSNFNTGISLPKVNIKEIADAFVVEMAVPGLKKSDFKIDLDNFTLSISAEIEENKEETNENYTRREFGYSSFKRTFTLPETVDDSKINASYNEGVLNIHLPKREEAKQKPARTIKIS
ncbi:heat-shock protein [Pseudalgibacter alginicilyticus]|uniref:Heat-shock protein n=1 Tax=Pseudalgibacter alginicilyticus TaxID=1736674 RepID=A0A0P0D1A8_9FLAO|nr:Hsp20/alpha crystallin family protein [Pseudalgibacter alginicilyticus]ALJ04650.1 heat-shock protein [Pseudalgibacter alginicilyticus]